MRIMLTVPGQPIAKARPRRTKAGITYTPKQTVNYETLIKELFAVKYPDFVPFEGPLRMTLLAWMKIPGASKIKTEAMKKGDILPTKKPDISNILKAVEDALESVAYINDRQIIRLIMDKKYSPRPRIEVIIEEI